jgi:hypothetical protein
MFLMILTINSDCFLKQQWRRIVFPVKYELNITEKIFRLYMVKTAVSEPKQIADSKGL